MTQAEKNANIAEAQEELTEAKNTNPANSARIEVAEKALADAEAEVVG